MRARAILRRLGQQPVHEARAPRAARPLPPLGRQDTLERWARTTYAFYRTTKNNLLNWLWMLTGALACAASVICMVNMAAWFQLAYLGTLAISSLSELLITILVRRVQNKCSGTDMVCNISKANRTWSQAVIRSSLEVPAAFSLGKIAEMDLVEDGAEFIITTGRLAHVHLRVWVDNLISECAGR